jgi:hypothetical protein
MRDWGFWFLNGFGTTQRAIGKMGSALKYMIISDLDKMSTQGKVVEIVGLNLSLMVSNEEK